jgi:hypothetical protein
MSFFNLLLISVLSVSFWDGSTPSEMPYDRCESLRLEFTIETESKGQTLILKPQGGQTPYKLILSAAESGEMVSEDFTKTRFTSIKPGQYVAVIVDNGQCMIKTEIQVP